MRGKYGYAIDEHHFESSWISKYIVGILGYSCPSTLFPEISKDRRSGPSPIFEYQQNWSNIISHAHNSGAFPGKSWP
jgi:hypothetical protein